MANYKTYFAFNVPLRFRVVVLFLFIGLLPLGTTGFLNIVYTDEVLRQQVIEEEAIELDGRSREIERFLETTVDDILLLSQSATTQELSQAIATENVEASQQAQNRLSIEFENFVKRRNIGSVSIYERIRFLDSAGFEVVRVEDFNGTIQQNAGQNFQGTTDYFVRGQNLPVGEIYVSPIELYREGGQIVIPYRPILRYSTPIYVRDLFVGIIVTDINAQSFLDLVQANLDGETTAFLVDQDGYYLSHPETNKLFGRDLQTNSRLAQDNAELIDTLHSFPRYGRLEFEDYMVFYQVIIPPGQIGQYWVLFAQRPLNAILAPVNQLQRTLLIASILVGVIVAAVALVFASQLSKPLLHLTRAAERMTKGDYSQQVKVNRTDEIGTLGKTFNLMAENLTTTIQERDRRIREIEELSATLEQRVHDRTRELQTAADVARQLTTVLNIEELLQAVVQLTGSRFQFYATFVFLYEADTQLLHYAAGADKTGQLLKPTGLPAVIPLSADPSIIALAARTQNLVAENDIKNSRIYLSLSDLYQTQAELAIPMLLGDKLLGVFDIQSDIKNRFKLDEIRVLKTLAEQITIAVRNAQLFAEMEAARKVAEQADKVKSQFLASMSHELRTPLNAILNFTEFVADGLMGAVNEKQEDALRRAIASGEHLLSLINDILDLTKIEVGMMELFIEPVDFNATIESVLATTKGLLRHKPIELVTEITPALPMIRGDKRRLRQILLNLLSNAVKFTPQGTIALTAELKDLYVHIRIKDTGIGIDQDDQPIIFENFRQGKNTIVTSSGSGLGLPITKYLVEAHHGRIWVESELNVGSTFYVELPIQNDESAPFPVKS